MRLGGYLGPVMWQAMAFQLAGGEAQWAQSDHPKHIACRLTTHRNNAQRGAVVVAVDPASGPDETGFVRVDSGTVDERTQAKA